MAVQLIKRPTFIIASNFKNLTNSLSRPQRINFVTLCKFTPQHENNRNFCVTQSFTLSNQVKVTQVEKLSMQQKLKKAVAEYGTTVIVFHISISLLSLGTCYFLISNGFDVGYYVQQIGISNSVSSKLASGTGTFVAAYAIHKVFAPLRLGITLTTTPFIVRYLRNKGILKK